MSEESILMKEPARRRLAQCIMPRLDIELYVRDEEYRNATQRLVKEGVGGFCVFKGTATDCVELTDELQSLSEIPLLFSGDFEYGLPMRLEGGTAFPHAMALGAGDTPSTTHTVAQCIAKEARSIGVHWNLAPVCDINSNPKNPIVNIRSFGETAEITARHAEAYVAGIQAERALACAKHFPGHGDTTVDSHVALPTLDIGEERLKSVELAPFYSVIKSGVRSVMVGHLALPLLDDANLPASLSQRVIEGILRKNLGFSGIIVTDALDMKSISSQYSSGEAAVRALLAGVDIALMPEDPFTALDALQIAHRDGRIKEARLQDSLRRIFEAKRWCGLLAQQQRPASESFEWDIDEHRKIALAAASAALQTSGEFGQLTPITQYSTIAGFALVEGDDIDAATRFFTYLAQTYEDDCHYAFVNDQIEDSDLYEMISAVSDAELIIFVVFVRPKGYKGHIGLSERMQHIIQALRADKKALAILFGSPYVKEYISADAFLDAYSFSEGSLGAAALKLTAKSDMAQHSHSSGE